MIEILLEYSLNYIDYAILIFFFSKLIEKNIKVINFLIYIALISLIQYFIDLNFSISYFKNILDSIIIMIALMVWGNKKHLNYLLYALMLDQVFLFSITSAIAISTLLNINSVLLFSSGIVRYVFSIVVKIYTITLFCIILKPLVYIKNNMNKKSFRISFIIVCLTSCALTYIYKMYMDDKGVIFFVLILTCILLFDYFIILKYCEILKQNAEYEFRDKSTELIFEHIENFKIEYNEIRKIKHDIDNQMLVMQELLNNDRYEELKDLFNKVSGSNKDIKRKSISGNLYIDALLNQKIKQYQDIHFHLNIKVVDNITHIENKDLISLLSNIIDNACEELYRIHENDFKLDVIITNDILKIVENNKCRKNNSLLTDKYGKGHGYGMKIIKEIVDKYEGEIDIKIGDEYIIKIYIAL